MKKTNLFILIAAVAVVISSAGLAFGGTNSVYDNAIIGNSPPPVAYWPMQETKGPTILDVVSNTVLTLQVSSDNALTNNAYNNIFTNAATNATDGKTYLFAGAGGLSGITGDTAVYFTNLNGQSTHAQFYIPYSAALDPNPFTAEAWIKVPVYNIGWTSNAYQVPLGFEANGGAQNGWWMAVLTDSSGSTKGELEFNAAKSTPTAGAGWTTDTTSSSNGISGSWVYVVEEYTGTGTTNLLCYTNGVQAFTGDINGYETETAYGTHKIGGAIGSYCQSYNAGASGNGFQRGYFWHGAISHVAIYNAALTVAQITNHYYKATNVPSGSVTNLLVTLPGQTYASGANTGTISNQTTGTQFAVTLTAVQSGATLTSFTGSQTVSYSGPANAPNGTAPGYTTNVSFTNGQNTNVLITLYDAQTTTITPGITGLTGLATSNLTVAAASAAKLAFVTQPGNGTTVTALSPQPVVALEDTYGNTNTGAQTVSMSISNNPGSATLSGTTNITASSGVATFTNLSIGNAGIGYTLSATGSTVNTTSNTAVVSTNFNVTGPAAKLVFTTQPGNSTGGAILSTNPVVTLEDSGGNIVTGTAQTVTVSISNNPSGGTLSGTVSQAVNTSTGQATFTNLSINTAGTGYTLSAVGSTVNTNAATAAGSSPFNITVGAATKLAYTSVPSAGTAGTAFSVTVQSQDAGGNASAPAGATTITLTKNSGGGTLSGTLTGSIPTSSNSVTISTPVYSKSDTLSVTATASGGFSASVNSAGIPFTAGAATQLAFTTQPGGGTGGAAWAAQPAVTLEDANGNTVTNTAQTVSLAIQNNPGSGTLSGTTNVAVNTTTGVAGFSGLSINNLGYGYTLTATGSTVDTSPGTVVSSRFNIVVLTSYDTNILGDAPVSYWPMQEPTGPTIFDYVTTNAGPFNGTVQISTDGTNSGSTDSEGHNWGIIHNAFTNSTSAVASDGLTYSFGGPGGLTNAAPGDKAVYFTNLNFTNTLNNSNNAQIAMGTGGTGVYEAQLDSSNFSVEAWINVPTYTIGWTSNTYQVPLGLYMQGGTSCGWFMAVNTDSSGTNAYGEMFFGGGTGGGGFATEGPSAQVFSGKWVYAVQEQNAAGFMVVYTNGTLMLSNALPYQPLSHHSGFPLFIGSQGAYYFGNGSATTATGETRSDFWNGGVSHVAYYNYALPATRVTNHYYMGTNSPLPSIATQPANQIGYITQNATFTVTANGAAPLSYQWLVQSGGVYVNLSNGGQFSGVTNTTLIISNLVATNATNYEVMVANAFGSVVSAPASLTILAATPSIITPPAPQSNYIGKSVTFGVVAAGLPPLSYQWAAGTIASGGPYTNLSVGGQFSSVTNTNMTVSALVGSNALDYVVVVTNSSGSITSAPATLTVLAPTYATTIEGDGPISFWPLHETSGTVIHDLVGTNNGTAENTSGLGLGGQGTLYGKGVTSDTAIYFTNTNSGYIFVPYSGSFNTPKFTVEAWFKMPTFPVAGAGVDMRPLSFDFANAPDGWTFEISGPNGANPPMLAWCATGATWTQVGSGTALQNQWAYYVETYNGTNVSIYTNGVLANSSASSYAQPAAGYPLYIGAYNTGGTGAGTPIDFYQGGLENVAVYSNALTAAQITNHYYFGTNFTQLIVTLPGQTFTSGSGNSGTISNQTAGTSFNITLTAVNNDNTIATTFSGSQTVSYSGPANAPGGPMPVYTTNVTFVHGQAVGVPTTLVDAQTTTITANIAGLAGVATSNLTVVAAAATQLAFTTQPGNSTAGLTLSTNPAVTLLDTNGNTVTGTAQNVTLAIQNNAGSGMLSGTTTVAVTTNTGVAAFSGLSINKSGAGYTLTATGSTVDTSSGTIISSAFNITPDTASAAFSTLSPATASITANGTSTQVLIVQARDVNSNNLTSGGSTVVITNSSGTGTIGSTTDNGNGTYSATVTSPTATGSGTFTATLGGTAVGTAVSTSSSVVTYTPGAANAAHSTLSPATASITANGTSTQVLTVQVRDVNNNNLTTGGSTVVITNSSGTGTIGNTTDNGNGTYSATVTSPTTVGSGTFTATLGGTTVGTAVSASSSVITYTPGAASAAHSTLSPATASITANGTSTQVLTVQVRDVNSNNLTSGGSTVVITNSSGTGTIGSTTDNGNGTYSATVTSPTATGSGTFTATLGGTAVGTAVSASSSTITYTPGAASAAYSTISPATVSITANGTSTQVLTVQARDVNSNNLTTGGATVVITNSLGTGTIGSTTDNTNGTYTATVTAPVLTGSGTFIATLNGTNVGTAVGASNSIITYTPGGPPTANPMTNFISKGTDLKISITNLLATYTSDQWGDPVGLVSVAGGLITNNTVIATTTNGSTVYIGASQGVKYIVITPANTNSENFPYVVNDTNYPALTATNLIYIIQTNAVGSATGLISITNGMVITTWAAVPYNSYVVQVSTNLSTWADLSSPITAPPAGVFSYTNSSPPYNAAYYRLRQN